MNQPTHQQGLQRTLAATDRPLRLLGHVDGAKIVVFFVPPCLGFGGGLLPEWTCLMEATCSFLDTPKKVYTCMFVC